MISVSVASGAARGHAATAPDPNDQASQIRLEVELDAPLPDRIAVGRGTALFLKGRCAPPTGRRVIRLAVASGADEYPVMAQGISERRGSGAGDTWWGIVPFAPVSAPESAPLALHAVLDGGEPARGDLGTVRLEPWLDERPVSAPSDRDPDVPLIAICMATFEPPLELFARQVESIRAQTYGNWICVISDDNSGPEHLAEMRRIIDGEHRFHLSCSEERRGFYGNFERAMALAPVEADYVGLADQDDRWYPDKLEALAEALRTGILAYSDMRVADEDGTVRSDTYWRYRRNNYTDFTSLVITNSITGAAALFRRELLEWMLPFPPPHGDIFHDHWMALVAMVNGPIRYIDRPLYEYVQHSDAAIGFTNANAGRGRWGGRFADVALRVLRLGWRIIRPVGRIRYFDNYCRLALEARALEIRCGESMEAGHRRALRRILSCDDSLSGAMWLGLRAVRPVTGRNETMGMERGLLAGIVWRRIATLRARIGRA